MFSKPRTNEPQPQTDGFAEPAVPAPSVLTPPAAGGSASSTSQPKAKPAISVLSSDLIITGNIRSSGDIQIEGSVEGDIRAQTLIVGESATVKGEVIAEEVVVHGRVIGRLRGLKVRLSTNARVEGDIIHKSIAIESGAHFEGSVQRQDDPVGRNAAPAAPQASGSSAAQRVLAAATAAE